MLSEKERALLSDREAQEAITARGELLGCPHCNGKGKIMARQKSFHGQNGIGNKKLSWWIYVKCTRCHARSKPVKTEPIKLYADYGHVSEGCFYSTAWHLGAGRGLQAANDIFRPYVQAATREWNHRTPLLTPAQMAMLEREMGKIEEGIK